MPEGPEVLRCGEQLREVIKGRSVQELAPVSGKLGRSLSRVTWDPPLGVSEVTVKGKVIVVYLADGPALVSTLGMSGWWYGSTLDLTTPVYVRGQLVTAATVVAAAMRYVRVKLVCTDGAEAYYVDPRNFGNLRVTTRDDAQARLAELGPDLLKCTTADAVAGWREAQDRLGDRTLGEVALSQEVACGLGNIYRSEALYLAGLHPLRRFGDVTERELGQLARAARAVLRFAYATAGSLGYAATELIPWLSERAGDRLIQQPSGALVYGCRVDPVGYPVKVHRLGGRTVYFVDEMQS